MHVHTVLKSLPVSDVKIKQIQDATRNDSQMQTLKDVIRKGWPANRQDCPKIVLEYWNHRDELSYENGIVFKGQKLIIPSALRTDMIVAVYIGHFGIEKTVGRARDIMFWPLMTKQITDHVLSLQQTQRFKHQRAFAPS